MSVEGKGGTSVVSLLAVERVQFCWVIGSRGLVRGRVGGRLESAESGEGPCALAFAQERMRSRYDSESGNAFFIDKGKHARGVLQVEA